MGAEPVDCVLPRMAQHWLRAARTRVHRFWKGSFRKHSWKPYPPRFWNAIWLRWLSGTRKRFSTLRAIKKTRKGNQLWRDTWIFPVKIHSMWYSPHSYFRKRLLDPSLLSRKRNTKNLFFLIPSDFWSIADTSVFEMTKSVCFNLRSQSLMVLLCNSHSLWTIDQKEYSDF